MGTGTCCQFHYPFNKQENACKQRETDFTIDRVDQNENSTADVQQT